MSDTPRTDKFYFPLGLNSSGMAAPMVMDAVEFARQLERELVEAEALAAELQDKLHRPAPPAEQGDTIRHDMARILQTACDADEADPRSLLNEIAQIASKHPWPTTKRKDEQSISTEEARNGVDNQGNRRSPPHSNQGEK